MLLKNYDKTMNNALIKEITILKSLENQKIKGNIIKIEILGDFWLSFINQNEKKCSRFLPVTDYFFFKHESFLNKEISIINKQDKRWKMKSNKINLWFKKDNFIINRHSFIMWLLPWYKIYSSHLSQNRTYLQNLFLLNSGNKFKLLNYLRIKPRKNVLNKIFFYVYKQNVINTKLNLLYAFFFKKYATFFMQFAKKNNAKLILILARLLKTHKIVKYNPQLLWSTFRKLNNLTKASQNFKVKNKNFNGLVIQPHLFPGINYGSKTSNVIIFDINNFLKKIFFFRLFFILKSKFFYTFWQTKNQNKDLSFLSNKEKQKMFLKIILRLSKRWAVLFWLINLIKKKYKYFYLKTQF